MQTVLVTGGMGFIGGHLVEALLDQGYSVLVVDNREAGCLMVDHPNVTYALTLSVKDVTVSKHIDHIIHLAAWSNVRESMTQPYKLYADNVMTTASLIQDVLENELDVRSFVFASSSAALSPESHYGISKRTSEEMLQVFNRQTEIPVSILRFANVYGPRQSPVHGTLIANLVRCALNGKTPTIYGDGLQERDYIYVSDVVAAIILSMEAGISCNIGDEHCFGVMNVSTGKSVSVNHVMITTIKAAAFQGLSLEAPTYENAVQGDKQSVKMPSSQILFRKGWRPKMPLHTGIGHQMKWAGAMEGVWEQDYRPDGSKVRSE